MNIPGRPMDCITVDPVLPDEDKRCMRDVVLGNRPEKPNNIAVVGDTDTGWPRSS